MSPEASALKQGKGKNKALSPKNDALGSEEILSQLTTWAAEKEGSSIRVAVTGLANVIMICGRLLRDRDAHTIVQAGKSSFLNSLLQKAALPVYSLSTSRGNTTTILPQEITITVEENSIHLIDTPGLTFFDNERDLRARDILLHCKGRIDRLKDPSSAVAHIVEHASAEDLMLMYNLPAFSSGDVTAFLSGVARSNHLVKKRGEPDSAGASRIVLRDWNTGKFARYTCPPNDGGENLTLMTEVDKRILNQSKTRKELRKNSGLVRLQASEEERRVVQMESPWEDEKKSSDEDDVESDQNFEADEEGEMDGSESDGDKNVDTDEQEERSEKESSTYNQKRKRTVSFGVARPVKKTAFVIRQGRKQDKSTPATDRKNQEDKHTKTILKKNTTTKKSQSLEISSSKSAKKVPMKVANVSSSYKSKTSDNSDPNAYDFSKFF